MTIELPLITSEELYLEGKIVLVRTGMDVPLDDSGNITDDSRIREALPTIHYLIDKNAKIVLLTHIGRPRGITSSLRITSVAARLAKLLDKEVKALDDCIGKEVEQAVKEMQNGDVIFLENLRFHKEEGANNEVFAHDLASIGDIYVNDAFSNSHREHASIVGIPKYLPSYAGVLLEKEVTALTEVMEAPKKPFIVVLGGAKVSDKIEVIRNLGPKADKILIGGAMVFTFYKAKGFDVGASKLEHDKVSVADDLLNEFSDKIVLPIDIVAADKVDREANIKVVAGSEVPEGWLGLDIGPESVELFKKELADARTVVLNGPMGVFEIAKFSEGTLEVIKKISELAPKAVTVVGGGDTLAAIDKLSINHSFTHLSTGGGAMLSLLGGKTLPGINALLNSPR
jgi:phosphoglycerate kinase